MFPAAILMKRAGRTSLLKVRRTEHQRMAVENRVVMIRDQAPLHRGNMKLQSDCTFEEFIESLNSRVFFWPGTASGPISHGLRHFERYEKEHPAVLRIDIQSLLLANPLTNPLYCRYNSGSPRCSYGQKSPRGPDTFVPAAVFNGTPSRVVEVTFDSQIVLPSDTKCGGHPLGPWRSLFLSRCT